MKVKIFTIRLSKNELELDQNSLNDFLETVTFKKSSTQFVELENDSYWSVLVHYEETTTKRVTQTKEILDLSEHQQKVYENLRLWRNDKADKEGIKSFMICHNSELMEVVTRCPNTTTELKEIKGFGNFKAEKYGDDILSVLNAV